jgi:formate/nitrite transporter FocA (FNT family)
VTQGDSKCGRTRGGAGENRDRSISDAEVQDIEERSSPPVLSPELRQEMLNMSAHIVEPGLSEMIFKSIAAGFLMAAMVWMLPGAEAVQFHLIVMMTWLIAAAGFMHIVAGSVEAFMLVFDGAVGWGAMLAQFWLPALVGNAIGGTALFALIAYAQVMKEI